jgi:hypothetical protein
VQKDIAAALVEAPLRARVHFGRGKAEAVRRAALASPVTDLAPIGLTRLVLDSRGEVGDDTDRRVIHKVTHPHRGQHLRL